MLCTYSDCFVHGDRYGNLRPMPPAFVVIHTTEGSEGPSAAEGLASVLGRPGDRTTSSGSRYGSSYHAIADTFPHVIRATAWPRVAFAAAGGNTQGLHIVIPGKAGQTRAEWLDAVSRSAIRTVAAFLVDVAGLYGIPLRHLSDAELAAGGRGYVDHAAVSRVWKQSSHWDCGPNFPWDVLASDISELSAPPPTTQPETEEEMNGIAALYIPGPAVRAELPPDTAATFVLCASGDVRHASMSDVQHARHLRVPEYVIPDMTQYAHCVAAGRKGMPPA